MQWTRWWWLLLWLTQSAVSAAPDRATLRWIQNVMIRWEHVCRGHLNLPPEPLPWIVFYDDQHAWHIHPEPDLLPPHRQLTASVSFAGRRYPLVELDTSRGLWLPDGEVVPVRAEGATKPYAECKKVYVQMAVPALWWHEHPRDAMPEDHIYSEALHELTHTRQLVAALSQIREARDRYRLPDALDDDIIERTVTGNEEYRRMYEREKAQLERAVEAPDLKSCRHEARIFLEMANKRQEQFFRGEYEGWAALDDVFLALEGTAVWVQGQMALDQAPRRQSWRQTLVSLAPFYRFWSQEEGMGLFLLIDRLTPGWKAQYFGSELPSPFETLRIAVGTSTRENPQDR